MKSAGPPGTAKPSSPGTGIATTIPAVGRYIESDPIGLAGGQPTVFTYAYLDTNTYAYVDSKPLAYSDPKGPQAISLCPTDDPDTPGSGNGYTNMQNYSDQGRAVLNALGRAANTASRELIAGGLLGALRNCLPRGMRGRAEVEGIQGIIRMELKQIRQLAECARYDEALAECDKMLDNDSDIREVLRVRAYIHTLQDNYAKALGDRKIIISGKRATIRDYYQAGESALFAEEFIEAVEFFEEVLRRSETHHETWFTDASYFLLAVAEMNLGHFSKAEADLDKAISIQPDIAMPLPHICGLVSHQQLRAEIRTRARSSR